MPITQIFTGKQTPRPSVIAEIRAPDYDNPRFRIKEGVLFGRKMEYNWSKWT